MNSVQLHYEIIWNKTTLTEFQWYTWNSVCEPMSNPNHLQLAQAIAPIYVPSLCTEDPL